MRIRGVNFYFLAFIIIFSICLLYGIYSDNAANILFQKAIVLKEPTVKSEKINYYKTTLELLSRAILLNKNNSDYVAKKGDLLAKALEDNFQDEFSIKKQEIEGLYNKAITLNPANFEYHLRLGLFYAKNNDTRAEQKLKEAVNLYPFYYKSYLYLAKYYIAQNKEKEVFFNLLLSIHYSDSSWDVVKILANQIKNLSNVSFKEKEIQLVLLVYPFVSEYSLGENGFPRISIPLILRVYMKKNFTNVQLYKDGEPVSLFKKKSDTEEFSIYELTLNPKEFNACLDDFKIKVNPPQPIEKIEFIHNYR